MSGARRKGTRGPVGALLREQTDRSHATTRKQQRRAGWPRKQGGHYHEQHSVLKARPCSLRTNITGGVLQWERFVAFVRSHLKPWRVQYWTANLGNEQGRLFFSLPPSYKPKEEFAPV